MKARNFIWLRNTCAGLLLGSALLYGGGCAHHETPAFQEPYAASYDYYYYPDANVYYDPAGGLYYWNQSGRWESGRQLPSTYSVEGSPRQQYRFRTREPWTEREKSTPRPDTGRP